MSISAFLVIVKYIKIDLMALKIHSTNNIAYDKVFQRNSLDYCVNGVNLLAWLFAHGW
jgi:hypothetical protein